MLSLAYVALFNYYIIFNSNKCEHFMFLEGENATYGYLHINNTRLELMEGGKYGQNVYATNLSSSFVFNWIDRSVNDSKMVLVSTDGYYARSQGSVNISFLCGFGGLYQSLDKEAAIVEIENQNLDVLYILFILPLLSPLLLLQRQFRQVYAPAGQQETEV